ncbi:MAG TPA: fatty acid desaturase [Thermoanaerobaculia bacterium]|nr:fatty acid desaturase [Thermoanaerobaculia bacterium]
MSEATIDKPRRVNVLNTVFLLGTLLVALVGTPWYILKVGLGWPETVTFFVIWLFVGLSITAGYHRLFAHKTYQAAWPVRLFLLVFGAGALENSVLNWAADHRVHHAHVDHDRDPYNITKGFWWAHIGWIFFLPEEPIPKSVVRDLSEDPLVVWQDRYYKFIGIFVALGIPLIVGLLTGRVLGCLLIGGVLRIVVSHHGTFFINSLCHMVGGQPYSREHSARDSAIMAVLAFGEGYHNYHHSFPFDYRNGVKAWHFDPAKWMIWAFSKIGLARDLRRAPEAVVLKAKIEVQFESAKERMEKVVQDLRVQYEARLHEAYASLQNALQDLHALQRRQKPQPVAGEENLPFETRVGLTYHALEKALQEWKKTLRQAKRLPVSATA